MAHSWEWEWDRECNGDQWVLIYYTETIHTTLGQGMVGSIPVQYEYAIRPVPTECEYVE